MPPKEKKTIIVVQNIPITVIGTGEEDFISLTDMAKAFEDSDQVIKNWLQNKNTIEFLSVWERLNNPNFNLVEFHQIKTEIGLNRFVMSAKKWIDQTNAIGLRASAGRYGGTYAHKDIAFEFGTWLSPEFKLFLIKEFQRLKEDEARRSSLEWNLSRALSKINYRIHTDAIKEYIIPKALSQEEIDFAYPTEADLLNMALFGMTAKTWREANLNKGNLRENASVEQLVVLSNLESINALLIQQGISREQRLLQLRNIADQQLTSLLGLVTLKQLPNREE
jgi:hypothetical protein